MTETTTLHVYTNDCGHVHIDRMVPSDSELKGLEWDNLPTTILRDSAVAVFVNKDGSRMEVAEAFILDTQQFTEQWAYDQMQGKQVTLRFQEGEVLTGKLLSFRTSTRTAVVMTGGAAVTKESERGPTKDVIGASVVVAERVVSIACNEVKIPLNAGMLPKPRIELDLSRGFDAETQAIELAYTVTRVNWQAFYQLILTKDYQVRAFKGNGRVINCAGSDFERVKLKLVTGSGPKLTERPVARMYKHKEAYERRALIARPSAEENLYAGDDSDTFRHAGAAERESERYTYPIEEPQTLKHGQELEVSLFAASKLDEVKHYYDFTISYLGRAYSQELESVYHGVEFKAPHFLTGGMCQVYREKDKQALGLFEGQGEIQRAIKDERILIDLGKSINVKAGYTSEVAGSDRESQQVRLELSFFYNPTATTSAGEKKSDSPAATETVIVRTRFPLDGRYLEDFKVEKDSILWKAVPEPNTGMARYDIGPLPVGKMVSLKIFLRLTSNYIGFRDKDEE